MPLCQRDAANPHIFWRIFLNENHKALLRDAHHAACHPREIAYELSFLLGTQLWPRNAYDRHFLPPFFGCQDHDIYNDNRKLSTMSILPRQVLKCVLLTQGAYPVVGKPVKLSLHVLKFARSCQRSRLRLQG